jgi:RecB family endonuclease NucS
MTPLTITGTVVLILQCQFALAGSASSVLGTLQRSLIIFATH